MSSSITCSRLTWYQQEVTVLLRWLPRSTDWRAEEPQSPSEKRQGNGNKNKDFSKDFPGLLKELGAQAVGHIERAGCSKTQKVGKFSDLCDASSDPSRAMQISEDSGALLVVREDEFLAEDPKRGQIF